MELAKALFDLATDLQKSGVGTGIDTLRANVQYQNERQRDTEAETELKISLFGLSRLLNLDPEQPVLALIFVAMIPVAFFLRNAKPQPGHVVME